MEERRQVVIVVKNITFDKTTTKEHPTGHLPVAFGYEGGWFLLVLGGLGGGQGWVEVFCRLHACILSEH